MKKTEESEMRQKKQRSPINSFLGFEILGEYADDINGREPEALAAASTVELDNLKCGISQNVKANNRGLLPTDLG